MNNTINTQSGERLSFLKLFNQKKYRVLIPIIQRDYAQGRENTKEVRDTFLKALYKYLDENKPNRDLDFVYGSLNEVDDLIDFIPLDGQQRLTTLFLLHWYLYQISENVELKEEFKNSLLKDGKSMFTYETRSSSSDFCNALMSNDIDLSNLLESENDKRLSKTIKNCAWFYLSWQYDPTIQSMLTMLDAIHIKFTKKNEFFERLLDIENPIITFLFLNLKDFKLTDDLYIKMNSRGKPLTPFENFKAKFEQLLNEIKLDRKYYLKHNDKYREVTIKEYFSYNIDTKWANLFWNYRTLQNRVNTESDDTFDDELMNFIRVILTNQYAFNSGVSLRGKDDTLEYLLGTNVAKKENKDYSDIITYHKYKELEVFYDREEEDKYLKLIEAAKEEDEKDKIKTKREKFQKGSIDRILFLIDVFDSVANGNEKIKLHLCNDYRFYFDEEIAFENTLKHSFESNHQRLCFHAYVRFLVYNENDLSGINQWMRVIHNFTHPDNTIIDNASEVAAAIKSIEELLPNSNNIIGHLKSNPSITFFSSWQALEEKIKAHLITRNEDWKKKIEEVEKHGYFNGQIGFILEFSEILQYYNANKNCDWDEQEDKLYYGRFKDYAEKAFKIFEENYENRKNNENYVFERAVLSKGFYLTEASQNRWNLLSTNLVKNNIKRDHSWKRLLRISDDNAWKNRHMLVKQVFDDSRFDTSHVYKSLTSICQDKTNTWRDYLLSCPALIEYCNQGFIRFENEHYILLYGESQSNFYHVEMYTYYLWRKFIEPYQNNFEPFKRVFYNEVKSIDDDACIVLNDFCFNRIHYQIQIFYRNNDKLPNAFEIAFRKSKGENLPEHYGEEIKYIINQLKFSWTDEYAGYFFTSNEILETLEKLKEMTGRLNKLTTC